MSRTNNMLWGILTTIAFAAIGPFVGPAFAVQPGEPVPGEPGAVRRVHVPYRPGKLFLRLRSTRADPVNVNISQIEVDEFPQIKAYVQVTDQAGQSIPGLAAANFTLEPIPKTGREPIYSSGHEGPER